MSNTHGSKWIRPEKRHAIYARDGYCCVYCGTTAEDADGPLTLDHVTPREMGGSNQADNLVACCLACNSAKRHASMRTWFAMLRDRGVDTSRLSGRVKRQLSKAICLDTGRRLLAARKEMK